MNANDTSQVLVRGTELGVVEPVELLDNGSAVADAVSEEAVPAVSTQVEELVDSECELTEPEAEVIEKMMVNLPSELDDEQRAKVRALVISHRGILSTGEHDIGRTHLVEHRTVTGDARPIRQPLRRQAFEHAKFILKETDEMSQHGIIEPAVSPWS